jgi:predicted AlkP superfamily pyrophosphatase or phosphodiesterase
MTKRISITLLLLALSSPWVSARASSVLMISIDGMKPEYVTHADAHSLKIPVLRSLLRDGAFASGVHGVWPTITYPSHTTLVTGVSPAVHGIVSNAQFDPMRALGGAWYWYADAIRVPTLWQAAHNAGLITASVGWPVTVGASIDYLIPEYWRGSSPSDGAGPSDRSLMDAISRPDGMLAEMQSRLGPYMMGNQTTLDGDWIKSRFAIDILDRRHPAFMTVHLSSLDESEHEHGPFSPEANQTLEGIDKMIGQLWGAARKADPEVTLVVVSDHGFLPLTHTVNLTIAFVKAHLIEQSHEPNPEDRAIIGWKAQLWTAGGMVAVQLHDPDDRKTAAQVNQLLHQLAADPGNGIDAILDRNQIAERGAYPEAAFLVVFQPGYYAGNEETGPTVTAIDGSRGGHGFSPDLPDMRSSFFAIGSNINHHDLGLVDMRQIAPTIAAILHISLGSTFPPLALQ